SPTGRLAKAHGETLAAGIAVHRRSVQHVVGPRVMQRLDERIDISPHRQLQRPFAGGLQKAGAVKVGLGDGGLEAAGTVVDAETAMAEAVRGAKVGEGGHDRCGAGATDTILGRYAWQHTRLVQ